MANLDAVMSVARSLFPDEEHDGRDCRAEVGREGLPCRICEDKLRAWHDRINAVHNALLKAGL